MPIERETIVERSVPSETVVVDRGGNGFAMIGGVVAAIALVLLVIWLLNGGLSSTGNGDINVDLPNVSVTQ